MLKAGDEAGAKDIYDKWLERRQKLANRAKI